VTTDAQRAIPCVMMRGGTSRGAYFRAEDLPRDEKARDAILIAVMGGPDALQVDGIGGGHPLTSKVAIVGPSESAEVDVDYLFLQIDPTRSTVSTTQNCGNILAGVGPFAVECGWVAAAQNQTRVRVGMVNSGNLCDLILQTPGGRVCYDGETHIDGVPGMAAPIVCEFLDVAGSACGSLFPTGNRTDVVDGVEVTCIDNGMPVVLLRARDLGVSGRESPEELDSNESLKAELENIRLQLGGPMNLGEVADKSVPKMCLISHPVEGHVNTRTFIPHVCHRSIGVLGAVTVATACTLSGTVAEGVAKVPSGTEKTMAVEHPAGSFLVRLTVDGNNEVQRAGVVRTARKLFAGEVYIK
jgi:4-oxalomesaconate tautomerase